MAKISIKPACDPKDEKTSELSQREKTYGAELTALKKIFKIFIIIKLKPATSKSEI